jgi:hypothetical protein
VIASELLDATTFLSYHEDGIVSVASVAEDRLFVSWSGQQGGGDDLARLTTTWTDANGVTHSVATPIPSTTEGGIEKSLELHQKLVKKLQTLYPPRDPSP